MGLRETQTLLARIFTDAGARRDFFADRVAVAVRFGLSEKEAETFATLDRREVEAFARSLLGKRVLDARKALPLTAKALGKDFDALLDELIDGPPAPERHRADAAALVQFLAARGELSPPWIADLARFEMAFISAARPGAVFLIRRFDYPVNDIARQLLSGARPDDRLSGRFGFWLRAPGGKLIHRMFQAPRRSP